MHHVNQDFATMLDQDRLRDFKSYFDQYVHSFHSDSPEIQRNFDLKIDHTIRVCREILELGRSLGLSREELYLAESIALFHDIGRFEQYALYSTFFDPKSEDHAALGVKVLKENHVLDSLEYGTADLIMRSVSYHNRASLPKDETEACLLFSKLLRDADKLDIWRVVIDYYQNAGQERNNAIELDLKNTPEISDQVYEDLLAERIVRLEGIETLNDFKLLQMGWIYDLNFPKTFELVQERGYLEMIFSFLPQTEKVMEAYSTVRAFLEKHCRSI